MSEPNLLPMMWLVAAQFLIYALGWLLAIGLLKDQRVAVAHWSAFMLAMGGGFVLTTLRDEPRTWLTFNGSNLLFILGHVLVRRGIEHFMGQKPHDREHLAALAVAAVGFGLLPPDAAQAPWRVMLAYGLGALVLGRAAMTLTGPVCKEYGRRIGLLLLSPAWLLIAMFSLRTLQQAFSMDRPLELHRVQGINISMMLGYLLGAAMFNFSFLTLVMLRLVRRLRDLSLHDALTGLPNRRALEQALQREWERWRRHRHPFAVVALDLDHFKSVNDQHGHLVGDELLAAVGQRLTAAVRGADVVARTGGEEFLVLMPDIDDDPTGAAAWAAAERLRAALADAPLLVGPLSLAVTASLGVARVQAADTELRQVLSRADDALYAAKAAGRNRVRQ